MSDEFLKERHKEFNAPEALVFELVRKSTNSDPLTRTKIVAGNDNEVYRVATKQNNNYFVRIKHFGEVTLEQEAWALEQCRKVGVPVADVFLLDKLSLPDGRREVMVCSEVPGRPLDVLEKELPPEDWAKLAEDAGRTLRKIHSIKVDGFYHRLEDGSWDFTNWNRLMEVTLRERSSERPIILSADFSAEEFDFMLEVIKKYAKEFPCDQPVLCHGDYWQEHIFATPDLKISGVIDFGEFQGGPSIIDFAQGEEDSWFSIDLIRKGYNDPNLFDNSFARRLAMQRLTMGMGYLAHHLRINHADEIPGNIRAVRKSLKNLRNEA